MDPVAQTDEELAMAFQGGDSAAFEALVRRHQGRVYGAAYRVTGNREEALDVAQQALWKMHQQIHRWKPGVFLPWLLRLTTNQAIDSVRRRARRPQVSLDAAGAGEAAREAVDSDVRNPERQARARETGERIRGALLVLSERQRTVFVLRHYEGMALAEIAEATGCSLGSVKVHLFRALRKLQQELEDLQLERY
jgi:RNA polymerase sigma-70 factor, ECF subfamily